MRHRPTRSLVLALFVASLIAACGGGKDADVVAQTTTPTTATRPPTTTTSTTAPTTTAPPVVVAPLTGLPFTGPPLLLFRPALVVKIDNAEPRSRPQQGLNQADVVYEEMVEGSVTRFAAVFHSTDALNRVVPVRSARTTDIALFSPLNHPLFAWSGANSDFVPLIRSAPIVDVGVDALPSEYHRDSHRYATHDLYTTTQGLWSHAPAGAVPPPPLFSYRAPGEPVPASARAVNHASVVFGGGAGSAPADWWWDASTGGWARAQKGTADVDETGQQIAPANVIIQFVQYRDTHHVDTSGAIVYEAVLVGYGKAWLLTNGHLVEGTWRKSSESAVTEFLDASGAPMKLTPGRTWVELPWDGRATVSAD